MKKKLIYPLCVGGMVLLVLASLFLPQIIFSIQDKLRMENTEVDARSRLEVSGLGLAYEKNTNVRLNHFLGMQEPIVTAIEYEFTNDSELQELLEKIFMQDIFFAMPYDMNTVSTYVYSADFWEKSPLTVKECKKYLIHGRDYQDGVALMMWYLDLYLEPVDTRIRILVDTETETIYYVKITDGVIKEKEEYRVDKNKSEQLYYVEDNVLYHYEFYSYYEADEERLYDEELTYLESEAYYEVSFPLRYGELCTDFQMRAVRGMGIYPNLTMGIPLIGEKIPEMMQD